MTTDFMEYYFLSNCYEQGVTEETVYKLFIEKIIADYPYDKFPYQISISTLHKYVLEKYKIEIPPTFIKSLITSILGYNDSFIIKKEIIVFFRCPHDLQENYSNQQKVLDENTRNIFEHFNTFLQNNGVDKISYRDFNNTLSIYFSKITNINPKDDTELSKILILWIKNIYKDKNLIDMQKILDKLIYSWLLFSYFYSVKRSKKRLQGNTVILDTNLIVYLLGINGSERQFFVEYLIEKLKTNHCALFFNSFSINELKGLLCTNDNMDILVFKRNNPALFKQLTLNTEEYLCSLFQNKFNTSLSINSKLMLPNDNKFKDLVSSLKTFKGQQTSYDSAEHDIKLIYSAGEPKKISNIYSVKKMIATSDSNLTKWFASYMKNGYDSEYINLFTLNKINLIFWIESDKCISSDFLMNTWMSVSDSISFFKNQHINRFFDALNERYRQETIPPDNWRSIYLVLKENLPDNREPTESDLLNAIDKISKIDAQENFELLEQMNEAHEELKSLREEVEQLKKEPKTQVIIQEKEKKLDEYSFIQLLIAILKKCFLWFLKK